MPANPTPSDRRRGSRKSTKSAKPPKPKAPTPRAPPAAPPTTNDSQDILDLFHRAFHPLFTPRLPQLLQQVKTHLFHRDYHAAFGARENLEAYAVRWSPSRALCYTEVFLELVPEVRRVFELSEGEGDTATEIVCVGGGAGAEVVAAAAVVRRLLRGGGGGGGGVENEHETEEEETGDGEAVGGSEGPHEARDRQEADSAADLETDMQSLTLTPTPAGAPTPTPTTTTTRSLHMTAIDLADWAPITSTLTTALTTAPSRTRAPFLPAAHYTVTFHRADILSPTTTTTHIPPTTRLITLLFTTNELYAQSRAATTAFLLSLAGRVQSGCLLLVLESAGSYSTVSVNGRTFPMGMMLDHTLLEVAAGEWVPVVKEDARWFRRAAGLRYPLELEDMRFMVRVYRRV